MILTWNSRQRHISLSEGLLSALNYPHLLIIECVGESDLILYQAGDPRVSPGAVDGRYQARIEGGAIVATAWR